MASVPKTDDIRRKLDWRHWPTTSIPHDYALVQPEPLLEPPTRPELEDQALIAWGLAQSELGKEAGATVDVLYGSGAGLSKFRNAVDESQHVADRCSVWKYGVEDGELEGILSVRSS